MINDFFYNYGDNSRPEERRWKQVEMEGEGEGEGECSYPTIARKKSCERRLSIVNSNNIIVKLIRGIRCYNFPVFLRRRRKKIRSFYFVIFAYNR